ncbi:hypothetical protein BKA57DRAFT_448412 [Linnemannia elongata]|nr:hypothetical protein BKA57DRAFT_448412 [Linnemannia elongata]
MESSHQQQQPKQQPQSQQRQEEKRPSSTASAPEPATRPSSITLPPIARAQEAPASLTLAATSAPNGNARAAQTGKSIGRGGPSSSSPPVAGSAHVRLAQPKQVLDTLQESQSPNLRTRLSRLFRPSPKSERSSSLEPRHRVQQKQQLNQEIARTMPRLKQQQQEQQSPLQLHQHQQQQQLPSQQQLQQQQSSIPVPVRQVSGSQSSPTPAPAPVPSSAPAPAPLLSSITTPSPQSNPVSTQKSDPLIIHWYEEPQGEQRMAPWCSCTGIYIEHEHSDTTEGYERGRRRRKRK